MQEGEGSAEAMFKVLSTEVQPARLPRRLKEILYWYRAGYSLYIYIYMYIIIYIYIHIYIYIYDIHVLYTYAVT